MVLWRQIKHAHVTILLLLLQLHQEFLFFVEIGITGSVVAHARILTLMR